MRHGNPPNFDAEPLFCLREIARSVFGYDNNGSIISKHLREYYAKHSIHIKKRQLVDRLSDEKIFEMPHKRPLRIDVQPLVKKEEISNILGIKSPSIVYTELHDFYA